eukprot:TRINITY_DN4141_c0_g2_i1.p1 TRINITY_DN4141_c0_g2~~TRINITY_DN4141_c0_g2_i1.p1  ORF type:complete len:355 (-),score=35.43 TRINITY_DN4141_c0_g2_i1:59-1123(-)
MLLALLFFGSVLPAVIAHQKKLPSSPTWKPLSPGTCIGDLCVPIPNAENDIRINLHRLTSRSVRETNAQFSQSRQTVACEKSSKNKNKVMLVLVTFPYHGSTAFEQVLMSSPDVATLCSARTWQCEAKLDQVPRHFADKNLLHRFTNIWNMSKIVLLDKGPLPTYEKVRLQFEEMQAELKSQPEILANVGVRHLNFAYILSWRPVCLSVLSHNTKKMFKQDKAKIAQYEMKRLEDLVNIHKFMTSHGIPVQVVNFGDMLWRREESKSRLLSFLPCLDTLDFDFIPQLGVDVFLENKFKPAGSVQQFGMSVDPSQCCGYNVLDRTCDSATNIFNLLSQEQFQRAQRAEQYLLKLL